MADENNGSTSLDLNLIPMDDSTDDNEPESEPRPDADRSLRIRNLRSMFQTGRSYLRQFSSPATTQNLVRENRNETRTGEGSVFAEEKNPEVAKTRENEGSDNKEDVGKNNLDEGSFFDCHICLDLARDPVVTCCGHLFCWTCLYRWLDRSVAKQCPVCKGDVKTKNVTPIYGRVDDDSNNKNEPVSNSGLKIPPRPKARRVESLRQVSQGNNTINIPVPGFRTFDRWTRLLGIQTQVQNDLESHDIVIPAFSRHLTSRGSRTEHAPAMALNETSPDEAIEFPETNPVGINNQEMTDYFSYVANSYMSTIAAQRQSGILTVENNALGIDTDIFVSDESSDSRNDASRLADVNSGDSWEPLLRRRRLN